MHLYESNYSEIQEIYGSWKILLHVTLISLDAAAHLGPGSANRLLTCRLFVCRQR